MSQVKALINQPTKHWLNTHYLQLNDVMIAETRLFASDLTVFEGLV